MKMLPSKPSKLIKLALKDLELVEKDPNYKVDMDQWHMPNRITQHCQVCLAGSIMAKTLKTPLSMSVIPSDMGIYNNNKLRALDCFRGGFISAGMEEMRFSLHPLDSDIKVEVTPYELNPINFKKDMLKIANIFKGLAL